MEVVDFSPIDVEQTSWQTSSQALSQLRHEVFVKEQGVPADEEFDSADAQASHWIAYGAGNEVVGCARLIDNKIGRMAVLQPHRGLGIGSALMRRIIRYAADTGLQSLQLNAQTHAVPFYEGMYFDCDGEEFIEAGLPHRHMTLSLKRFLDPRVTPPLPDIQSIDRERVVLDDAKSFNEQAKLLVSKAQRQIRIFSKNLDPRVYDNEELYQLMLAFARAHAYAEVHILVGNPHLLVQNSHRLLHLFHRLPSRIQIRSLGSNVKTLHTDFMLIDQAGILYNQSSGRYAGYAVYHAPLEAMELINEFDNMWNHSEPNPELRQLPI